LSADSKAANVPPDGTAGRYKRELALLRTVMGVVNSSLEPDQILSLALRTILEMMGPEFAGRVLLLDGQSQGSVVAAQHGLFAGDMLNRVFVDDCPCSRALETGMPIFEPDCPSYGCHSNLSMERPHGHLSIPLIARQTIVGVACLFCPPDFQIETGELSLWADIGNLIGKAVEDARLYGQLQQQQDLLQMLYAVSDHLATSLDLDWVLSRVLDLAIAATEAQDGSIFLLPTAGAAAPRILRRDLPTPEADQVVDRVIGQGLAGWVIGHKTGAIVVDTAQDPRWLSFLDEPSPPGSALVVPLMTTDQVWGVLTLTCPDTAHFQNRHLVLMMAIAHQASVAIEKARLYKEVAHLAEVLEQRVEERTRELRETQAQLIHAEKLAALGELAAGVAHEINNPLHVLQAYVEYMITRISEGDPIMELMGPIQNSLESIAHLTMQLRDFSRPAIGECKPMDINKMLTGVLELAEKELMRSKVVVRELLSPVQPVVLGDARQLEQVFLNLILNARDAMPGGGQLTIETFTDTTDFFARFTDTGIGIAEADLPHVFEPYFTTKADHGTGLGLAICQRIVTQHGGKIQVVSELGKGAVFTIQLPVAHDPSG
jgi:signal transduction histidine kinase